jgi:branched-chain amino acid transport system ATP-binding protein
MTATATATPVPEGEASSAALAVEHVSVRFGGLQALDSVNLSANKGEIVGLIGPNGAGKTTLLNVITGLIKPQSGTVSIAGRSLGRASVHRRARRGLARTFQRVTLFSELSVRQHIQLAAETARRRHDDGEGGALWGDGDEEFDADALIHRVGLPVTGDADVLGLPLGYARLVELAMALAARPAVLLLDEPFSGLGTSERDHLSNLLCEVEAESEVATVLVEHDVDIVTRIASRVVVLDFGLVIGSGPPAEVLADPAVRQAYFGLGAQDAL